MSTYNKEGTKLKSRLIEQIDIEGLLGSTQSKNALKKVRRTLGAVLFSPDNQGYLDVVEDGLAAGNSADQIMKKLRRMSEKYVEAFSPVPGVTEAHHIIPLNSLRDKVKNLPLEDQIEIFNRLDKAGWKLGDSPQQLMNTVFTRMSHQGQLPRMSGKNLPIKKEFQGLVLPNKAQTAHPRGTNDKLLQVQGNTVDEIWTDFTTRVAPLAQTDAANAILLDASSRRAAAAKGQDFNTVLAEDVSRKLNDPLEARGLIGGVKELAAGYNPNAPTLQQFGVGDTILGQPTALQQLAPILTGYSDDVRNAIAQQRFKTITSNVNKGYRSLDPLGAALSQGGKITKQQGAGGLLGAVSDPQVGAQVARGKYGQAGTTVAANTVIGAGIERGFNAAAQFVGSKIGLSGLPSLLGYANPFGAALGGALAIKGGMDMIEEYQSVKEGYSDRFERRKETREETRQQYQQMFGSSKDGSIADRAFAARDKVNNN